MWQVKCSHDFLPTSLGTVLSTFMYMLELRLLQASLELLDPLLSGVRVTGAEVVRAATRAQL